MIAVDFYFVNKMISGWLLMPSNTYSYLMDIDLSYLFNSVLYDDKQNSLPLLLTVTHV